MNLQTHVKLEKLVRQLRNEAYDLGRDRKYHKTKDLIDEIRSILDDDYHSIISDEQFLELGHIYYGGTSKQMLGAK
jgi:hypothetical protein